jgi:hypothetical protein
VKLRPTSTEAGVPRRLYLVAQAANEMVEAGLQEVVVGVDVVELEL